MVLSDGATGLALTAQTRARVLASRMKGLQIRRNMGRPPDDGRSRLLWESSNTRLSLQGVGVDSLTLNVCSWPDDWPTTAPDGEFNRSVANGCYLATQLCNYATIRVG